MMIQPNTTNVYGNMLYVLKKYNVQTTLFLLPLKYNYIPEYTYIASHLYSYIKWYWDSKDIC